MQKTAKGNISEKFSWIIKGLKNQDLDKSVLVVDAGTEHVNFAVLSSEKEILVLRSLHNKELNPHPDGIDKFIEADDFLQRNYSKVLVSVSGIPYTIVPKAFFNEENKSEFLGFNNALKKETICFSDFIGHLNAYVVYGVNARMKKKLDKLFPSHQLKSSISVLLDGTAHEGNKEPVAWINFRKDAVDLVLYKKGLVFCNSFAVLSPEDLLYFVLSSLELNSFVAGNTKLIVTGETETNSMTVKLLKKYIKNIEFARIEKQFSRPVEIEGMPSHYYYHLLNRIQCE